MPAYLWEATTKTGEIKKGEMQAPNEETVKQRLKSQALTPDKVKKKPREFNIKMPGSSGITTREMVIFSKQFSTMIDAGLPLVQCLDILAGQMENPAFKKVLMDVKQTVESGKTLAESLKKHPKVFDRLYVNLVAAGEASGVLDTILARLSSYIEKNMKIVKQVKGALVYPVIILCVAFAVTLVLLLFVIPVFQKMFTSSGQALPAPTQFVVDLSEFTQHNVIWLILGIVGVITAIKLFIKNPKGRRIFDKFLLKAPVFGPVVQKVAVSKFTRTMGTMLSSGVNILEGLEIVAGTAGNVIIEEGLMYVRARIAEGKPMAQPLAEIGIFPSMVVQMISVGEATGAMDTMLNKIADFYDDEVDNAIGTMMSLIEPIVMAFLAVILGGLVIAMYLPVFTMAGSAGG
jgi:type IV pilus assembly protein PilC